MRYDPYHGPASGMTKRRIAIVMEANRLRTRIGYASEVAEKKLGIDDLGKRSHDSLMDNIVGGISHEGSMNHPYTVMNTLCKRYKVPTTSPAIDALVKKVDATLKAGGDLATLHAEFAKTFKMTNPEDLKLLTDLITELKKTMKDQKAQKTFYADQKAIVVRRGVIYARKKPASPLMMFLRKMVGHEVYNLR